MITDRCWACERSSDEPHAEDCKAEIDRDVADMHQPWCDISVNPSDYSGARGVGSAWCSCGRRVKNRRNEPNRRTAERRSNIPAQSESPQDDGALVWASFYEGKVMKRDMAGGPSVWWNRASAESASLSGTAVGLSPTARPQDTALAYLESKLTLHNGVEILYVVDGYEVSLTTHDGATTTHTANGPTLLEAITALRETQEEAE